MRACSLLSCFLLAGPLVAGEPPRFKFQPGQSLTYTAKQVTTVVETTLEEGTNRPVTAATVTKLTLTRRWDVKTVDPAGVASLDLTIVSMRQQLNRPGVPDREGKPTIESEVLDSATPEGRQQMAAFLGKPIGTLKVNARGEVLEAVGASAERLRVELPFRMILPETGERGERSFAFKASTGERYDLLQTYTLNPGPKGVASVRVSTAPKSMPTDPAEWPLLAPVLWQGEASFDAATGRYLGARLTAQKEVLNHHGEQTRFSYESVFTEEVAR